MSAPFSSRALHLRSAPRAETHSGLPAGLGAGAAPWVLTATLCLILAFTAARKLPAPEIPPDTPTPQVTPPNPTPPSDRRPRPDGLMPLPESEPDETARSAQFQKDWEEFVHHYPWHPLSFQATAATTWLAPDFGARAFDWQGQHLPRAHHNQWYSALHTGRLAFSTDMAELTRWRDQFKEPDAEADHRNANADPVAFLFLNYSALQNRWRDTNGRRYSLDWQTAAVGLGHGHAGIHSFLLPVAGAAWLLDVRVAYDHLALRAGGGPTRYRDGVRYTIGMFHLDGNLWSDDGPALGLLVDSEAGLGGMGGRIYGVAAVELEPRIGYNFLRAREIGNDIPFGGIYIGFKSGGRWLWTTGPHPIQLQNAFWVAPTLTAQLFF